MSCKKLVITGMGAVTPIGIGVDNYWSNLIAGACGISQITKFDASELPVRIAAEIKNFKSDQYIPRNLDRNMTDFSQYAYVAAQEALTQAGLSANGDGSRIGIVMGSALDGASLVASTQALLSTASIHKVGPRFVPMILGNMAAGLIAINYGFHGPSITINTACSSGGDALMTAAMLILAGSADAMVVVGGESIISPLLISSLAQAKALSKNNEFPLKSSRPFDLHRDGFVIGEGGGAIILESEENASKRQAKVYARLSGWGNTQDAYHITAPDPEGTSAARCMMLALERAEITPQDIGYVNAHGTSTPVGDRTEAVAIHKAFGTASPAVSSIKGATGHMMGAGGITEVIACIMALNNDIIPPTLNYDTPDPECELDVVGIEPRKLSIEHTMSNSLGFGGQNSSIIVSKYE